MSNQNDHLLRRSLPVVMAGAAGLLLIASLRLPLWHMRLEAPQYREEEALNIAVFPSRYGGDMREISVLNQYIGVHVPRTLPQFGWLPYFLAGSAAAGVAASLLTFRFRRVALVLTCGALATGLSAAVIQAKVQMHDIGHKRDQRTVLAGMHDFTPPFLGTSRIAQFTVTSTFGLGAWLIGAAMSLQLAAAFVSRKPIEVVPAAPFTKPLSMKHIEAGQVACQI
jgi:copper chaperone NosL